MTDYSEIFAQRAHQYHEAMQRDPRARDGEFLALLEDLSSSAIDLLDVPSGGGYLSTYLDAHRRLESCDFSIGFAGNRLIVWGVLVEIVVLLFACYTPVGNALIGTAPVPAAVWWLVIPCAVLLLVLEELRKWWVRRTQ